MTTSTHQVRDRSRILQFDGQLLSHSTSWRRGSVRWVEFKLYRTVSGSYVLSRIGVSLLFHHPECDVVGRNSLSLSPSADLNRDAKPCEDCRPDISLDPEICAEKPRCWAQVCETPEGVMEALYQYDSSGNRYMTRVAQRLMESAGSQDAALEQVYAVEHIS